MNRNTLARIVLTGAMLFVPQKITNITGFPSDKARYEILTEESSPLEKAGLEIYGEHQQALGTDFFEFYRLVYSNKEDESDPRSLEPLGPKTLDELTRGMVLKDTLEKLYNKYLESQDIGRSDGPWNRFIDGEQIIPQGTYVRGGHEAIDIFTQEGNSVLAPFDGLVVASGDEWEGKFSNKQIYEWNNKGLSPKAGNALIIYNPKDRGYLLISHFQKGILTRAGDIVKRGQILGRVGNSGNASIKGHGEHIHVAYKLRDKEGYLRGIDFSDRIKE